MSENETMSNDIAIEDSTGDKFPIVALGGSAGALAAFEVFFINVPLETDMAFIVIQHMDPEKTSLLPELIGRNTKMPVQMVSNNMLIEPNHVYIAPPNKEMSISNGKIKLKNTDKDTNPAALIDRFFINLADYNGSQSVGIVFSGIGKDGSAGIKAIKEKRGLTMVQKPNTASFESMPISAIETGLVDFVLPVEELPVKIIKWLQKDSANAATDMPINIEQIGDSMSRIFNLILAHTGNDFSQYKLNTVTRRIESRMSSLNIHKLPAYIDFLEKNSSEITTLFKELLIGVTNFFRDEDSFEVLKIKVIPPMLRNKREGENIRIWVTACSTGEEAYSIAILLQEILEEIGQPINYKIQIFATDLDEEAISFARLGIYSHQISKYVSAERLKKFFIHKGNTFQVNKTIREMVIFAQHSVIKDPPFTKLDLLCCRNLLIYLTAELQKKVIYTFRYALNPNGILFLGSSESLRGFSDMFFPVDGKWRIFRRRENSTGSFRGDNQITISLPKMIEKKGTAKPANDITPEVSQAVQKELLVNFAPPSVVINKNGDIVYVNGETGKYLQLPSGRASLNIFDMAREGLRFDLSSAIQEVNTLHNIVVRNDLIIKFESRYHSVNIKVRPFAEIKEMDLLLVIFEDIVNDQDAGKGKNDSLSDDGTIAELQKELIYTRKNLQSTIEEMEITLEEITSTNEEVQSTNEELQSANEELTTSKEEMQSMNEELTSLNTELQFKVGEFFQVNNDMKNFLQNADSAILFLDSKLNINRYSPGAAKIIKLIPSDVGRPITDIVNNILNFDLVSNIEEVMDNLVFKEFEVESTSEEWYRIRISPYRTVNNFIEGTVILFTNITENKSISARLERAKNYQEKILEAMGDSIVIMNTKFKILFANNAYYNTFKETSSNILNKNFFEFRGAQWNLPAIYDSLVRLSKNKIEFNDLVIEHSFDNIGRKNLCINGRFVSGSSNEPDVLFLVIKEQTKNLNNN